MRPAESRAPVTGERRGGQWSRRLSEFLLCSLVHFCLALATAFAGYGWDLDQLRSRTLSSRAGAAVNDVLMYPHDVALRGIANAWLIRNLWVIPTALIVHSLLWGAVIYGFVWLWRSGK